MAVFLVGDLGCAPGAWLGGAALTAGVPYAALPALGAGVALVALGVALAGRGHLPGHAADASTEGAKA